MSNTSCTSRSLERSSLFSRWVVQAYDCASIHSFLQMIDGVKLGDHMEEVDDVEVKMRLLVDMWGKMKQGDISKLSVAVVCPVCPDQVQSLF